jgi:hypothetical protein
MKERGREMAILGFPVVFTVFKNPQENRYTGEGESTKVRCSQSSQNCKLDAYPGL